MSIIDIDWNPNHRKLRQFALIWFCGFLLSGCLLAWKLGCLTGSENWRVPFLLWAVAAVVGLPGLLFPFLMRPVYRMWMAITFPIGWLLSHALLAIIYFGVFTMFGLFFRLIGRDPLHRRRIGETGSYWIQRSGRRSAQRYFQQF